jgi:choline-sulfatase
MSVDRRVGTAWVPRVMGLAVGGAAAAALIGFVGDLGLLLSGGAGWRSSLGGAFTAAALGVFVALAGAPFLGAAMWVAERLRRSSWSAAWPAPFGLMALATAMLLTDALVRPRARAYLAISFGFAALIMLMAVAHRHRRGWLLLLAVGLGALALDITTPRPLYSEFHDLAALVTVGAALCLLRRPLSRVTSLPGTYLVLVLAGIALAAFVETKLVDRAAPGWRTHAFRMALYEPRMQRACHTLVDFDGDGFSPVAWGGDCDDFDPNRYPSHKESRTYQDANCNGVVPPPEPSDDQRGLAPPNGDPDEAPGVVELVLLITIDCWRFDAFRPDVMPHLWELFRHGTTFSRLYTGGSRTRLSLPLVMRGSDDGPPLPVRLKKAGIRPMALFGYTDDKLNREVLAGFDEKYVPAHERWTARELTNLGLAKIHSTAGQRRFLWMHYFDAHYPYFPPADSPKMDVPPGLPADFALYLANLNFIDQQIYRLIQQLHKDGISDNTLVVVTADHGEGFDQHQVPYHGVSAFDMLTHVRAMVMGPGVASRRYDGLASHRDIPATVMGGFGLVEDNPDVERFGRSWLRLREAPNAPLHKFVVTRSARIASGNQYSMPLLAIVEGKYKLVETFEDHLMELYDPFDDPAEENDLLTRMPEEAARLDDRLQMFRDVDGYP